ncbi:hypothetical protein NP233_g1243 [Leucocoprinus birnbaumii]|uniref:Uncharacterized protein n=1 Tax=Leucocoprinus birnbaumii TaxID=56174 RepID=A0AAD5YZQ1_9AGAR|nr:hypothetical protein NP233_g1243 [Leucocoprinus birnbaumii]
MTANTPMFYIHGTKSAETNSSWDSNLNLHKRKVPRLTLATDVKTFNNRHSYLTPSMPPPAQTPLSPYARHPQMEVDEVILNFPDAHRSLRTKRSFGEANMDSSHGDERRSLDTVYPALLPTSSIFAFPTTACTAELPSTAEHCHNFASYPQHSRDTRLDKLHHLQPSSCYPSPPHSTAASPLELSNPLPPPIQPSPSLPLHQPRPSRRIPIVSLSRLASAAEKMDTTRRPNVSRQRKDSSPRIAHSSNVRPTPYFRSERDRSYVTVSREDSAAGRFVQCNCGCMKSYAVG